MRTRFSFILAIILLLSMGCQNELSYPFEGGAQVYFERIAGSGISDSITYSFAVQPIGTMVDTVRIPLTITGKSVNYDRKVSIVVDSAFADINVDYKVIVDHIKANEINGEIKVIVYHQENLKVNEKWIVLRIQSNDDFQNHVADEWLDYKVKFNDILTKPARWVYECQPYFGNYSAVKYRFIIDILGIYQFPNQGEGALSKGMMLLYKDKMKSELAKWEKENNGPMMDENKQKVTFD